MRKDLPNFQLQDAELNKSEPKKPVSYGNFVKPSEHTDHQVDGPQNILGLDEESRKRQRALWEEEEERNRQKSNVHYQDILYQGKIIYFLQTGIRATSTKFLPDIYVVLCNPEHPSVL